jgi:hypothetical protein
MHGSTLVYPNPLAYPNQNGDFPNSPIARDFTGPTQHAVYTNDYTTADNVTGLIYKTCSEGLSGPTCATGAALTYPWANAVAACTALNSLNAGAGYAGRTNWRLPNIPELANIINHQVTTAPKIDVNYFPGTPITVLSNFWSFHVDVAIPTWSWFVTFHVAGGGFWARTGTSSSYFARCVSN